METEELLYPKTKRVILKKQQKIAPEENFKPVGAFVFFILLVLLGMAIWFSIYYLMLERV